MLPLWLRSPRGKGISGPLPVPDLDTSDPTRDHRPHYLLAMRSVAVVLAVILGFTVSGALTPSSRDAAVAPTHPSPHHTRTPALAVLPGPTTTSTATPAPVSLPPATTVPTSPSTQPTPTPTTVATSTAAASPTSSPTPVSTTIGVSGAHLILEGTPYRFTGVNAYEAGTSWGTNAGCGAMLSEAQLNQLFAGLPPNSLVRIWGFQGTMATNVHTGQLDWAPLDRVFAAAAAHGQRLIVAITGQGTGCDGGHWQDPSWYDGGFRSVFNDASNTDGRGYTPLSYWTYLQAIVNHFKSSPALGMWEPISEAEASTCPAQDQPTNCSGHQTCPNEAAAAAALRSFFDAVGGEIHTLDPAHLVESGLLGGGQCGTQGSDFQYVSASPGIGVLSYHDYWGQAPIGGDQWNGMAVRFHQAVSLGKPIIAGETGLMAGTAPGCLSDAARNTLVAAKIRAQAQAGSSGLLMWDWVPQVSSACTYDIAPGDPLLQPGGAIG
jgi:mannan endo-1,4-beta-mannosidase